MSPDVTRHFHTLVPEFHPFFWGGGVGCKDMKIESKRIPRLKIPKPASVTWRPTARVPEDKVENSTQVTKTPLAGDIFCGLPGAGGGGPQQLTRGTSWCLFSFDAGSFGSPGRADVNDSAEAAHRCRAARGFEESGIKASHKRLISLSNVCRGVGASSGEFFGNLQFQSC